MVISPGNESVYFDKVRAADSGDSLNQERVHRAIKSTDHRQPTRVVYPGGLAFQTENQRAKTNAQRPTPYPFRSFSATRVITIFRTSATGNGVPSGNRIAPFDVGYFANSTANFTITSGFIG